MNSLTVSGHLGRDAEVKTTTSGKSVASASLAVSQGKDKPTIWLQIEAWEGQWAFDRLAAARKGQPLVVSGRLTMREWTDKEGATRQGWGVVATDIEWAQKADRGEERPARQERQERRTSYDRPRGQEREQEQPYSSDEDIPF